MSERILVNLTMQHKLDGIQRKIEDITRALTQTPDDHPNMPLLLVHLGQSHDTRFNLLGDPSDSTKAIEYMTIALTMIPDDDPNLPTLLNNLAASHRNRFQQEGEADDNDQSIEYCALAISLTPDGHPYLPDRLSNLGTSHSDRFDRVGEQGDLEKAIEYRSRAVQLAPDDHPELPALLNNLALSLSDQFHRLGDLGNLEKVIQLKSRAIALTPPGHPSLPSRYKNLGVSLKDRFEHLGEMEDLERAIQYQSRAVALTPDGHPYLPGRLESLGTTHRCRFERLGELDDLDRAIECQCRALLSTPDGHPKLSFRLAHLGISHSLRFQRLGELGDLEKAIAYHTRALLITPDCPPHLAHWLMNLGVTHTHRFTRLHELNDLEKAIEYQSRALSLTADSHSDMSMLLGNLGGAHLYRFQCLEKLSDLRKAVEYGSRALELIPNGHPTLPDRMHNLGVCYFEQFLRLGELEGLEKAIKFVSRAVELMPGGHPNLPDKHSALAEFYFLQYTITSDLSRLQDSLASFRNVSQSLTGSTRTKFRSAIRWAELATNESSLNCIEAFQTAISLLPQFIWLGATADQRYQDLVQAKNLAVLAARAAILSARYPLAVEWLEHARCVVWNQNLMLRSPLDHLHSSNPALATRLQFVAAQLHLASSGFRAPQALPSGFPVPEHVAQNHHQLAKEYDSLLKQARALPGFQDFLQPVKADTLIHAARTGPVVVINCHQDRCDALVVLPRQGSIQHIPLPNFSGNKAQRTHLDMKKSVRNSQMRERGVDRRPVVEQTLDFQRGLTVLWYDVVKPILDSLGYTDEVPSDNMPHITWCPTGALSFLPLHAAGDYFRPKSRIYDYVISSYIPTLTSLLTSTPGSLTCDSRVLAIGQTNTPGHSPLPGTAKELEYLRTHASGKVQYSQLMNHEATTNSVLNAMEQHDWVHLACHAHQNVGDPTKSGFFLHEDILDLASINRRSFKKKGLAYLSACQTATGDENLPDEAIHLASGMLMAGYSSVIATMWSVMDDDAPFVADRVYDRLIKGGTLGNGEAGKALHYAVAALREQVGEENFERWVPYIHIGS